MRSRTGSLPCSRCRWRYLGPPPSLAAVVRSRSSATSCCMRSRLAANVASDGSMRVSIDYHPQQSVLNPQAGQRQTACMRYISTPQRSQGILSSFAAVVLVLSGVIGLTGGVRAGSDMPEL